MNLFKMLKPVRPNMTYLGGSLYIVRTQAGFEQAVKHFERPDPVDWNEVEGYPKSYPSLLVLHRMYRGYTYVHVEAHHVKNLKTPIAEA
jgi:hypothetical protein